MLFSICPVLRCAGLSDPKADRQLRFGRSQSEAGRAYAVNVFGCILGPLFASYILLPWAGERIGLSGSSVRHFCLLFIEDRKVSSEVVPLGKRRNFD